jgi:hypothetical protein
VRAHRFELENTQREIARAKDELGVVHRDLARAQADYAKLVSELRDLRKQG